MKYILSLIISGSLVVSGFGQTRNVLVGTNSAVVQPTNFWSADASNARTGLGLGTAATNPASAFQPSSSNLSNVAANNGVGLTNLNATNLVGTLSVSKGGTGSTNASDARLSLGLGTASTNPATAFQSSSAALSNLASSNGGILTNLQAENLVGIIPASNIPTVNFTNITGTLSIASGGTGATNVANARQNLGSTTVGDAIFTASNAAAVRTTLSLGTASTSDVTSFQPASVNLTNLSTNNGSSLSGIPISGIVNLQSNLDTKLAIDGNASGLTNITAANINGTVALASNITGTAALATNVTGVVSILNGGTGTNTASGARASLGATTIGANLFTLANPDDVRFIRLNANNTVSSLTASDFRTALSIGTNLGTVTSIGMTVPSFLSVSTATITSSGTFAITLNNQTSRQLLITPNGGGVPAFRLLESDDLPSLAISKITGLQSALDGKLSETGTASLATNVTGVVALANGGTGATNAASARTALGSTTIGGNIFTATDASAVRALLSLGTASTNPASAFQPASTNLTLLASNDGSSLTNINISGLGTISISNISGLQSALDGKLATNGSAANLTSFPATILQTTSAITNFPAGLLRVNGDGSGLTNLPVPATASNVLSTVAVAKGGTGATNAPDARINLGATTVGNAVFTATNAESARTALSLGTAATSAVTAFQPAASALTNLAANNGGGLTNLQATSLVGTIPASNISTITISNVGGTLPITQGGTGATNASGARTALELGTAATNPSSAFQAASSTLTNLSANNGASLTNLTAANIVGTVGLASNITGTAPLATNVTGIIAITNGGTGTNSASGARTALGATTIGANLFTLANPDDTRFIRLNANNSVSSLTAADMRTALSVGTNLGTVTSVGMTVPNIFSLSGSTITSSGTFALTLANQSSRQAFLVPNGGGIPSFRGIESDDLPSLAIAKITGLQTALDGKLATNGTAPLAINVTGTVAVANGGTGGTTAESGRTGLGATTIGTGLFTLANPSSVRFIRLNADNTVSSLSDSDFRTAIGLGTASTNPATAFQPADSDLNALASNNGGSLTNITAANITGIVGLASNITGTAALATNVTGIVALANGGTGATNASGARTALELGTAATNASTAFQPSSSALTNLALNNGGGLTNLQSTSIVGIIPASNIATVNFSNLGGTVTISSGGTGATNAEAARTNLGLPLPALTNTNNANFRTAIGLGATNDVTFKNLFVAGDYVGSPPPSSGSLAQFGEAMDVFTNYIQARVPVYFDQAATTRTNLGLGLLVLTNTNVTNFRTGIGLGATWLTNTNVTNFRTDIGLGQTNSVTFSEVTVTNTFYPPTFSPTNLLTAAGSLRMTGSSATTRLVYKLLGATPADRTVLAAEDNLTNLSSAATARTNLGLGATWLTNTNTAGFNTSLYGSGTNPVLYNTNGDVVSPTNFWQQAPIATTVAFSAPATNSTNTATNSRNLIIQSLSSNIVNTTNTLLLPTNTSTFNGDTAVVIHAGGTGSATAILQAGQTSNLIVLTNFDHAVRFLYFNNTWDFYHNLAYVEPIYFSGTNALANAAVSRTNLGLGLPALTNTNNANFRNAIELGATNNVSFSNVTASGTLTATGTVTATTNLVVNGFVDFSTNHTNSNPATNNQINDFIEIRVGTNQFWLPVYK
jgi:hypothetical protein